MMRLRYLPSTTTLFVLLSGADLLLTCYLLRDPESGAYEANWLAAHVLGLYGFAGLAVFKGLVVLLFGTLVYVLARYRPVTARRLGTFACLAVAVVVIHSAALCARLAASPHGHDEDLAAAHQRAQRLDCHFRERQEIRATLEQHERAVAAGEMTLSEAASALTLLPTIDQVAGPLGFYATTPDTSLDERLTALVLHGTLFVLRRDGSSTAQDRARQLLASYRANQRPVLLVYVLGAYPEVVGPAVESESTLVAQAPVEPPARSYWTESFRGRPRFARGHHRSPWSGPRGGRPGPWRRSFGTWNRM